MRRSTPTSDFPALVLAIVLALGLFTSCSRTADGLAAGYPNRTIVVICPWAAGGGTDRVARFLADQLQREVGKPVVVQNQTGGSGATGHAAGARARPDGYTITMGTFELSTMRGMGISDLTYRDFQPLVQVNADPAAIIVHSDAPWRSLRELLDDVRQRPGQVKMSGTAAGGAWDLARAGMLLADELPVESVNWIPSQGAAPSLVELLGGHIDAVCCSVPEAQSQLEAGQLRVLCVMSAQRLSEYPSVPTALEQGVDWEAVGWRGLFLPLRTPPEVVAVLREKLERVVHAPAYEEFMASNGFGITIRGGTEFEDFLAQQEERWTDVIEAAGYSAADDGRPRVVTSSDPGPRFFPLLLAVGLIVGSAFVGTATSWRRMRLALPADVRERGVPWTQFWRERGKLDVVLLVLALPLYLLAVPWLGFFPATFVLATAMMVRLGVKWWIAAGVAAGMLLVVYGLFVVQFRVILPSSPWWP
jgi:tripartite-type tricarboxylate transporter receptor subunit TctC